MDMVKVIWAKMQEIDGILRWFCNKDLDEKVTKDSILHLSSEVKCFFGVDLPSEYVAILERTNGVEFNGFVLYGVDSVFFGDNAGSDNHRNLIEK